MQRCSWRSTLAFIAAGLMIYAVPGQQIYGQTAFPQRPVHIVIPFLAGGSADALGRIISDRLAARLGQQVVIENKAGAGGVVGADYVARAQPDGHTLLLTPPGPLTTNAFLLENLPYDVRKAFDPVTLIAILPNVLLAGPKRSGWTLSAVIQEAKANPEKLTYASQGIGTTGHLTGVLFNQETGANLTHVAYKGFPPALVDVMAGRVDLMFVDTGNALPRVRSNSLVPIAIASKARLSFLPNVPTLAELGYPSLISDTWFAVMAPAGTPLAIRQRIRDEIVEVFKVPEVLQQLDKLGAKPIGNQPDELDTYIRSEYDRWGALIKKAGIATR